ncbi:nicotinate-nucleotide--dimethylbenzimidazole phosphoribosyltransferase, partial [Thermodesulfobacteriota bacterium]
MDIEKVLNEIEPLDEAALEKAQARLDNLAIPRGSLGLLMDLGRRVAGIRGEPLPRIRKKKVFTFAADHGVTAEGVSAFPREVTPQ